MEKMLIKNELTFDTFQDMATVAEILLRNQYVVMLSREEALYVINYINTCEYNEANRNGVVFMSRDEFEDYLEGESENDTI